MQTNPADRRRKADLREAMTFAGFTLVLLGLFALMLWLSAIAPLKDVGIYLGATSLVGATCAFRARSDWKRSRMSARQRALLEEQEREQAEAAAKAAAAQSWARRIQEDS
ncbi:MAG: hypothetical protein ABW023_08655 [Sphingomonas sp.]